MRKLTRHGGFTLIEVVMVMVVMGLMIAIAGPRMRVSPLRKVSQVATQLANDIELARTRAMSTRSGVRVAFNATGTRYQGFLDDNRDGAFTESVAERNALRAFGERALPSYLTFGRGSAGPIPGDSLPGAITFANDRVEFDARGVTSPFGIRGTVYIAHKDYPDAVAAVSVSPSASLVVWVYRNGAWQ